MKRLHLASRSPRRKELLAEAGIPFTIIDLEVDESVDGALGPEEVVAELALRKARTGAAAVREGLVLGADTIVALAGAILGKPRDRAHAREMLRGLSGSTHRVLTGVCIIEAPGGAVHQGVDVTKVTMRPITEAEIEAYVESGEGDDKAGSYAIQESGDRFVTKVEGSWSNVVGLPMELVHALLRRIHGER